MINEFLLNMKKNYLFAHIEDKIKSKKNELINRGLQNPDFINLGIGDASIPISKNVAQKISDSVYELTDINSFKGYGDTTGVLGLKEAISKNIYNANIDIEDIFISDGAKCDSVRLQLLFSDDAKIGIQDPVYPAYLDNSILFGKKNIKLIPCNIGNNFFPNENDLNDINVLWICSPNNPTGSVITKDKLQKIVDIAIKKNILIIFDAAYSMFINDENLPKTIYEIPNAKKCAIEINSFSKFASFTGVRLGWSVVPNDININGINIRNLWQRIVNTTFNGASNIVQYGGIEVLSSMDTIKKSVCIYINNTKKLKKALEKNNIKTYGGDNSPFIWCYTAKYTSWDMFDKLIDECQIISTPGSGFGKCGENFFRISGLAKTNDIDKACININNINL